MIFPLKVDKPVERNEQLQANIFVIDEKLGINKRNYENYEAYLSHQSEKLGKKIDQIIEYDLEYESIVKERYESFFDFSQKSVLCLAARLGGEVRAFKSLGALALGIDIEPGENNKHVLSGDFHNIQFPDNIFNFAFSNAIDHVYDLEKFLIEIKRVLILGGIFILEFAEVEPSLYEVIDTKDVKPILKIVEKYFEVTNNLPITNETDYGTWSGRLFLLKNI